MSVELVVNCAGCQARYNVTKYPAGLRIKCKKCETVLVVPPTAGNVSHLESEEIDKSDLQGTMALDVIKDLDGIESVGGSGDGAPKVTKVEVSVVGEEGSGEEAEAEAEAEELSDEEDSTKSRKGARGIRGRGKKKKSKSAEEDFDDEEDLLDDDDEEDLLDDDDEEDEDDDDDESPKKKKKKKKKKGKKSGKKKDDDFDDEPKKGKKKGKKSGKGSKSDREGSKSNSKNILIALIAVVVIGIGVGLYFLLAADKEDNGKNGGNGETTSTPSSGPKISNFEDLTDESVLKMLPENTMALLYYKKDFVKDWPSVILLENVDLSTKILTTPFFLRSFELRLTKDVRQSYWALYEDEGDIEILRILDVNFDQADIATKVQEAENWAVKQKEFKKYPYFKIDENREDAEDFEGKYENPNYIVFLDNDVIAYGSEKAVKGIINRKVTKDSDSLKGNSKWESQVKKMDKSDLSFAVLDIKKFNKAFDGKVDDDIDGKFVVSLSSKASMVKIEIQTPTIPDASPLSDKYDEFKKKFKDSVFLQNVKIFDILSIKSTAKSEKIEIEFEEEFVKKWAGKIKDGSIKKEEGFNEFIGQFMAIAMTMQQKPGGGDDGGDGGNGGDAGGNGGDAGGDDGDGGDDGGDGGDDGGDGGDDGGDGGDAGSVEDIKKAFLDIAKEEECEEKAKELIKMREEQNMKWPKLDKEAENFKDEGEITDAVLAKYYKWKEAVQANK